MKVLISAFACHPKRGSEPGVGWNWLKEISKKNEVWVLFYASQDQQEAVSREIETLHYKNNIHLVPIPVCSFLQNHFYRIRYEIWQLKSYFKAKELLQSEKIDIIHQLTIASWWFTGFYYKFKKILFWGPISGGQTVPVKGLAFLRYHTRLYEILRNVYVKIFIYASVRSRMTLKNASEIFVANEATKKLLSNLCKNNNINMYPETGVSRVYPKKKNKNANGQNKLNLLWAGLLLPAKNFCLLFESLKKLPENMEWELRVAGDGKMLDYWKEKVAKLPISNKITFLGKVDYPRMSELYNWADVFVFPSLREATGTVIFEAMSHGVPVIALEQNGAKVVIDKECGILIPVSNKEKMITDFAEAIEKFYAIPELAVEMGISSQNKIESSFLWEKRGEYMNNFYQKYA